jgi:ElaB/YqjD/DUF883 family membrane-anchored ribosome-binding protein
MENKILRAETQPNAGSQFSGGGAQFKESPRGTSSASGSPISDSLARGKDAVGSAANEAINSAGSDLQSLQADLNGLKDTLTKFMSQAAGEAAKSAREVSSHVAGRVGGVASDLADRGADIASTATEQAKTFASELESMARRNPIGAMAGAVLVGILIGALGRRS